MVDARLPASREIVGEAVAAAAQAVGAPVHEVQEEMFAPPLMPAKAGVALTPAEITAEGERRRKAGRPPGAQNKATKELREWLLRGGVLPQKWMADWLSVEPEQLAARLGCTVLEAFDRQARLADSLAPYVMSRMAPSDDKGQAVPIFNFQFGTGGPENDLPPWERNTMRALADEASRIIDGEAA